MFFRQLWLRQASGEYKTKVRAEPAQSGTQGAGDEQSPNPAMLWDGRGGQGRTESWEVTAAQAGMNGRQLINPRNAAPERKTCSLPESRDSRALWANRFVSTETFSRSHWGDKWMCWAEVTNGCAELLNRALGSDVPELGNSLSLPPAGTHYKSFVTCSGVSLIPMTWASHGHTPEPTPDTKHRAQVSLLVWAGTDHGKSWSPQKHRQYPQSPGLHSFNNASCFIPSLWV